MKYVSTAFGFLALIVFLGIIVLVNWAWIVSHPLWAFLVSLLAVVASLGVIGIGVNGRPAGVLIDNRNRISLSKFQATAWTVLVVTALVTVAGHNLAVGDGTAPLNFGIPPELLAAMGISATSFVATPLVLSLKTDAAPTQADVTKAATELNMSKGDMQNSGKVFGRSDPSDASWADIFRGEEVGNVSSPDLSKIQQLFISVLLYGIYGFAIVGELRLPKDIETLPPLNDKFVWLLAVSHASYLAYKAAPHTDDSPDGASGAPNPKPVG